MTDKNQRPTKPPAYDYTQADRQRTSRNRRAKAYMIVKALAQRAGFMQGPTDMDGLDKFLDECPIEGHEIDWFEAVDDL